MTSEQIHETDLPKFNLFNVLGVQHLERQHSEVIAWLLDPYCSHGLYDAFLRLFLCDVTIQARKIGISAPSAKTVRSWNLRSTEVDRECAGIDIQLVNNESRFICIIENKVFSDEHTNQLTRYFNQTTSRFEGFHIIPVFLTPYGVRPKKRADACYYVPFSYKQIADLSERTIRKFQSSMHPGVHSFVSQYIESIYNCVASGFDFLSKPIEVYISMNPYIGEKGEQHQLKLNHVLLQRKRWSSGKALMRELKKAGPDFSESSVAYHLYWYRKWKRVNF